MQIDRALYDRARDHYEEGFYRNLFFGAGNSVGFHNPTEAMRVPGDAAMHAGKSEARRRQALAKAGVSVPIKVELELPKYLNNLGDKKLMLKPEQEIRDPFALRQ